MRTPVLLFLLSLLPACGASALLGILDGLDDFGSEWEAPPEVFAEPSRLAFLPGTETDNVICARLDDDAWDPIARFDAGTEPTSIALDGRQRIFVGNDTGIVELGSGATVSFEVEEGVRPVALDTTANRLIVAADTPEGARILVYDARSGALLETSDAAPNTTFTGLHVEDRTAYAVDTGGTIARYEVVVAAPVRTVVVEGVPGKPAGLTVGHNGNFFVADKGADVVREIDFSSGAEVGTLYRGAVRDLEYDASTGHYVLVTGGSSVVEIDSEGRKVRTLSTPDVKGAAAVVLASPGAARD